MRHLIIFTIFAASVFAYGCDDSDNPINSLVDVKQIIYVSTDAKVVTPYNPNGFGAKLLTNNYVSNIGGTITFSNAVTAIGEKAFWQCSTLKAIAIPGSVRDIGDYAFNGCENLSEITLPASVTEIGNGAFAYCDRLKAFYGISASKDNRCLVIGTTLKSFAPAEITTYSVIDGITEIGGGAFEGCDDIVALSLPSSVNEIDERAFAYCLSLESFTIPAGVTEISTSLFEGCSALNTIILPSTIKEIDTMAFNGCVALQNIYCAASTPPSLTTDAFGELLSDTNIYVPTESITAYQSAEGWSDYADAIVGYDF